LLEFWHNLDLPSPSQGWHDFPPTQKAITVFALALLFANFFVRDYNRGGKRYIVYGPMALLLFAYAIVSAGLF
jgi:hypothetical protein